MRGLNAMGWLAVAGWAVASGAACAGSEDAPPAQFAEVCDNDCAEGLECVNRVCTARCTGPSECTARHAMAICDNGYCFVPCMTSFNCPNGLVCTQQQTSTRMTCRAQ
jgi:hypothetical protein